jgi:hypothetical protein
MPLTGDQAMRDSRRSQNACEIEMLDTHRDWFGFQEFDTGVSRHILQQH